MHFKFVEATFYFYISCVRTAKALGRLRGCAGSPEHSLVAYVISSVIAWALAQMKFRVLSRVVLKKKIRTKLSCKNIKDMGIYFRTLSKINDNKSAASTAPCPATVLKSSKWLNSVKYEIKRRCIGLSLNKGDMNLWLRWLFSMFKGP